jgi:hypothetical protein
MKMKKYAQKQGILAAIIVLVLISLACLGSGNTTGNSGGDQPDYAATEASLSATQAAMEEGSSNSGSSDSEGDTSSSDSGGDTQPGDIDFSNAESGDVLYATDFEVSGDWDDDWFSLVIPSRSEELYSLYMENGYLYIQVDAKSTTVYAIYEPLFMPRDEADVLVETSFDNVGDVRNNNISVLCRVTEEGWYEFSLTSSGLWYIYKYEVESGFTTLFNGGVPNYNKNITAHVISATCIGDELTFYLDGEMLKNAQVNDRSFDSGGVGVSVYAANVAGVEVEFDWFQALVP